ncbi:hypothetical protein [Asaia astilbis]|uniref:hypothetical protein n=1 Tax=Asaia astilbis TaxID=610244 RepID=UPI00046F871F|nr:hypothetical protein [Asaia astilbis]
MYNKEVIITNCREDKELNDKIGYISCVSEDDFGSISSYGIFIFDEGYVAMLKEEEFRLTGNVYDENDLLTQEHLRVSRDGKLL